MVNFNPLDGFTLGKRVKVTYKRQVDLLKAMPEYNSVNIHADDIQLLVKTYDRCYECHASASIPFYYAE